MMKAEMSPEMLAAREAFLRKLEAAGWNTITWDRLLDRGMSVEPEAEADHAGPAFDMSCGFMAKDGYLKVELVDRDSGTVYAHRAHPKGGMTAAGVTAILDVITSAQGSLDLPGYPRLTKALIPLCDPLLVDSDEGLLQLTT